MIIKNGYVQVVVGILLRMNGNFLLSRRLLNKSYGGFWEFPGGKLEEGEVKRDALRREFSEELGVGVLETLFWQSVKHCYQDVSVCLHVFFITSWEGEPESREGQELSWQSVNVTVSPVLPLTLELINKLNNSLIKCAFHK